MDTQEFKELFVENEYKNLAKPVIKRVAYDGSGNPQYVGYAKSGTATTEWAWLIEKLVYDGSSNYSYSLFSQRNQVWDSRESLTYT